MAQVAMSLNPAVATRSRALWAPREHGAWGMLLVPLVTGAGVAAGGGSFVALLWFTIAAVSLFWLRTPVESLLGTSVVRVRTADERRAAFIALGITATISLVALAALFWGFRHRELLFIGGIAGLAFALQAVLKSRNRRYRALAQVIGSFGLTCTAASSYYLITGKFNSTAVALWVVNWLFAAEQIEFVQLRIRGARLATPVDRFRRGRVYIATVAAILSAVFLMSANRVAPALIAIAFAPAMMRAVLWFRSRQMPLDVHKLGWLELLNATVFSVLAVIAFRIA